MEDLKKEFKDLLFSVRRSVRYHNRRRRFFDRLHKISAFLAALTGTATVASVLAAAPKPLSITFALLVAIFSVIDLVVGTAQSARLHNDLSRSFFDLEKEIISLKEQTPETLAELISKRLDIEAEEPPPLHVLNVICHNELMRAMGHPKDQLVKIKPYQRIFAQFMDIQEHTLQNRSC